MRDPEREAIRKPPYLAFAAMLLVAAALRIAGSRNDLWLDEVWSLDVARHLSSALQVFTLHEENSHYLNTLWMFFVGQHAPAWMYRFPSLVAGVLTVAVAGLIARRRSRATAFCAMFLVGCSYELVLLSSEARGYSVLVLCAVTSYFLLDSYLRRPARKTAMAYAAVSIVGMLAHPMFASVVAAGAVWTAWHVWRTRRAVAPALRLSVVLHAAPALLCAVLYLIDLRFLVNEGGTPVDSYIKPFGMALAWSLGTPQGMGAELISCIIAVAGFDYGIRRLRTTQRDAWVFFGGAIVVFPIMLVIVRNSDYVYTRHFATVIAFMLILLSTVLGAWWERGGRWRAVSAAALLAYGAVNLAHIHELTTYGRGRLSEAVRFMATNTSTPTLSVGADSRFRIDVELRYLELHGSPKPIQFVEPESWPAKGPEWVIVQEESFEPPSAKQPQMRDAAGNRYELVRTFRAAPISGLHWFLYQNENDQEAGLK